MIWESYIAFLIFIEPRQVQAIVLQFCICLGLLSLPLMHYLTLSSSSAKTSDGSLHEAIRSLVEKNQSPKGFVVDQESEDHDILSRIVTGLQGRIQPPDTEKLFEGLTRQHVDRAMDIIKLVSLYL